MIKFVLLDLDDTIFDFHKAEKIAIAATLSELGIEPKEETLARYSEINAMMWKRLERGEITREEVLTERFAELFRELGSNQAPSDARHLYEAKLSRGHYYIEGAEDVLRELCGSYRIFIASNGTAHVQSSRIASSNLTEYAEKIFISEEIGYNKPSIEFFERCFAEIDAFSRDEAIIIGDSLSSDIKGGINAGILTCLFAPHGKPHDADIIPDFEISSLYELPALLKEIK